MVVTVTLRAVIVDSSRLFGTGGDVRVWSELVAGEIERVANLYCPPNRHAGQAIYWALRDAQSTGILKASIYSTVGRVGPRQVAAVVGAAAPHAKYVLNGTARQGRGFIYTTQGFTRKAAVDDFIKNRFFEFGKDEKGLVMWLPPVPKYGHNLLMRVHGQPANPFLTDAYARAAQRHPALPKKRFKRSLD